MHYMLLIYTDPDDAPQVASETEGRAMMKGWFDYTTALHEAGVHVAGDALHPADTASTVRVRSGERLVTDGPFAETKEWLGGYYVIDVPDLDAALDWAARMPNIAYGSVEVRPLMVFAEQPA
ncbi:MAG: YciI family protein [Solirubrobacterales bacterium]|nr:YciI family protein [Solirubrobacterales bacterium]